MHAASLADPLPPLTLPSLTWPKLGVPLLGGRGAAVLRRRAAAAGRVLAFVASSLGLAATLWLMLAGPGFLSDRAGTATAGHVRTVAQR